MGIFFDLDTNWAVLIVTAAKRWGKTIRGIWKIEGSVGIVASKINPVYFALSTEPTAKSKEDNNNKIEGLSRAERPDTK